MSLASCLQVSLDSDTHVPGRSGPVLCTSLLLAHIQAHLLEGSVCLGSPHAVTSLNVVLGGYLADEQLRGGAKAKLLPVTHKRGPARHSPFRSAQGLCLALKYKNGY